MRFFSTLRVQFVLVVAAAVLLSNGLVFIILDRAREGEIRGLRTQLILDRVGASFDLLANIPVAQREAAVRVMSGHFSRYEIFPAAPFTVSSPTSEEIQIARAVQAAESNANLGEIRVRLAPAADGRRQRNGDRLPKRAPSIEIAQALENGTWAGARYERPSAPPRTPSILFATALAALLTGGAAAWLAGRVSRPLSALSRAADEVARGSVAPLLPVEGPRDMRRAMEAFNAMSGRVTKTLEADRQLLSAVGHDLRTPLTALRITAEFVKDEDVRDRLMRNLDELKSLTDAVLSAARAGPGEQMRRVDLAALVQSVCDDLIDMDHPVSVETDGAAPCLCRPNEIRRALRNLIENAVRYGGAAAVSMHKEGSDFLVTIDDKGPGIPQDRLDEVFEPFVRLEESRSTDTGGAGLGLSLARTIAREHGGDVTLRNKAGGGLTAVLRLPMQTNA